MIKEVHPDFQFYLDFKEEKLATLYKDLRSFMIELNPTCNELIYHTHALTSVYSLTEKLSNAYCMIPIYTSHFNLGFNKGTLLADPHGLLEGTGKWIRHIPIVDKSSYRNNKVKKLIKEAIKQAKEDQEKPAKKQGQIISKIKRT